jgi:hypothetical protein
MKTLLRSMLIVMALATAALANGFNSGAYPLIYNSEKSLNGMGQSDVILTGVSNAVACEFYNNTGAAAYFSLYDSKTVAAQAPTGSTSNLIGYCEATSLQVCSISAGGPSGPSINTALVTTNGLTWFASSTFPAQAGIGSNGVVVCTYNAH